MNDIGHAGYCKRPPPHVGGYGFTRIELLTVLAAAGLLTALGASVMGSSAARTDLIVCANNLRQVGRAFNVWASDHGGENPWWVSYKEGGSLVRNTEPRPSTISVPGLGPAPTGLRQNAWFQFAFISQELQTPTVLVCPTDREKFRAENFSTEGGYMSAGFQDHATSYFVGLHAFGTIPNSMLSGDRTIKENLVNVDCSASISATLNIPRGGPYGWLPGLHESRVGNLLMNDGHVEELSVFGLGQYLWSGGGETMRNDHILKPN